MWELTLNHNVQRHQKTESFHWLRTLAMFDVMSVPAILSSIGRNFKFCQYINFFQTAPTSVLHGFENTSNLHRFISLTIKENNLH